MRFVIYTDDHEPAHVHVYGDGEAKFQLAGPDSPRLLLVIGMKDGDVRRARMIVREHREAMLREWNDIHG